MGGGLGQLVAHTQNQLIPRAWQVGPATEARVRDLEGLSR